MAKPRIEAVNQRTLSELIGLSPERIRQLVHEGLPQVVRSGRPAYVPREVVRWLRERERSAALKEAQGGNVLNPGVELALKTRVERQMKELDLEERRRQLVTVQVFDEQWENIVGGFAAAVGGALGRFERKIVQATTAGDARKLTMEMQAALMRAALEYSDELDASAEEFEQLALADEAGEPPATSDGDAGVR